MFDFIPLPLYSKVFYNLMLVVTLIIGVQSLNFDIRDKQRIGYLSAFGFVLMVFVVFYMGLRPVSGAYFGDMADYNKTLDKMRLGEEVVIKKDALFYYFMLVCSKIMSNNLFFLLVDFLYVLPMYLFSKKYFGKYWFFCLFMFLASFSFWAYGTNGLRNGLATSFFIWGLCYYNGNKLWMYTFFALSFFMHNSLVITLAAFVVSYFLIKNPRIILAIWLVSIPLSLVGGSFWGGFFEGLGFFEDRTQGYLTDAEENLEQFSQTGFRWDFLLYSATAIFAGWYFIFYKKLEDKFYVHLFGVYAIANAFWVLVIEAAFSNRFAYLSWFLMAPVIIYPICKYQVFKNQYKVLGGILFLYYLFTYYMNI